MVGPANITQTYGELLREFNALHQRAEELKRKAADIKEEMDVIKPRSIGPYEIWFRLPNMDWVLWGSTHLRQAAEERLALLRTAHPFRDYEIRQPGNPIESE